MKARKVQSKLFKIGQVCYDVNPENKDATRFRLVKRDNYACHFKIEPTKSYPSTEHSKHYFSTNGIVPFPLSTNKYIYKLRTK